MKNILTSAQTYYVLLTFVTAGLTAVLPKTTGDVSLVISAILAVISIFNHQQVVAGIKAGKLSD